MVRWQADTGPLLIEAIGIGDGVHLELSVA